MTLEAKNILIVDDDPEMREILSNYFRERKASVCIAEDGVQAIKLLTALSQLDLVVTDIVMPELDGIQLSIYLRKHFPMLPIIAISGGGYLDPEDYLESAKALGAWTVIEKPVSSEDLNRVIASI